MRSLDEGKIFPPLLFLQKPTGSIISIRFWPTPRRKKIFFKYRYRNVKGNSGISKIPQYKKNRWWRRPTLIWLKSYWYFFTEIPKVWFVSSFCRPSSSHLKVIQCDQHWRKNTLCKYKTFSTPPVWTKCVLMFNTCCCCRTM